MMNESYRKAVVDYVNANLNPVQDCCPEVVQYWATASGTMYWSNKTGERTTYRPNNMQIHSVRNEYYGTYIYYVRELDALEFSFITLKGNRGIDGEKKDWVYSKYTRRNFIFHNDTTVYTSDGSTITTKAKYANKTLINMLSGNSSRLINYNAVENEIKKFDGNFSFKHNWGLYDVHKWYQLSFMPRKKSAKANEITSYELSDETVPYCDIVNDKHWANMFAWFEIVDENYAVIRVFQYENRYKAGYGYTIDKKKRSEVFRIFISKDGKPSVLCKIDNQWVIRSNPTKNYVGYNLANADQISSWKPLKYIESCIDGNDNHCVEKIIAILRHPILESLIKSGYPNIAKRLLADNQVVANIKQYFNVKEGKGNIYKVLGVNKYLLKLMETELEDHGDRYNYIGDCIYAISNIKKLYGKDNISDLSKESVDLVYPVISKNSNFVNATFGDGMYYRRRGEEHVITEDERNFFIRLCKMRQRSNSDVYELFLDVKRMERQIRNMPDVDITDFKNENELMRLHDDLLNIQREEEAERRALYNAQEKERLEKINKKFEKLQPERIKKYEYEDGEFCVRVPKELDEITREGTILHHCVGGYKQSHAIGDTNIVFLRKKSAEAMPFYTVEIRNGRVVQIHGSHNRWLGNNPEAVPFVYEWLNKIGVKYDKRMLLNKGAGYSPSSENLPESYLVRK